MYIAPDSRIYILKKCPLDLSLDHTLYFANKDKQTQYFEGLAKFKLTEQSYTRYEQGVIKVDIPADLLYDCNYLMFQNTSFGKRWFYAYIRSVEYISNSVSKVNFVIDIMQTWFFDYELEQCFIIREHTKTDYIGENLVDEGLELGEHIVYDTHTFWQNWKEQSINIVCTFGLTADGKVDTSTAADGGFYSNIYSGLTIYSFPNTLNGTLEASSFLRKVTEDGASAGIVSVFMCPTLMVQEKRQASIDDPLPKNMARHIEKPHSNVDGYVPRNKKLFNYPYKYLQVTTDNGDSHIYHYELFEPVEEVSYENFASFREYYVFSPQPECTTIPLNYKGQDAARDERLNLSDFPNCAFTIDAYLAWLAQKRVSLPYEALSSLVTPAAETMAYIPMMKDPAKQGTLAMINSAGGAINFVLDNLKQKALAEIQPPSCNGSIAGGGLMTALYQKGFHYKDMTIRAEYAKRIDDFFTVYGYKVNKLGVPNRANRPHWTYVQTANCCIKGSVPCDDAKAICDIYNRGITFWKNGDEVGDYTLDNSP